MQAPYQAAPDVWVVPTGLEIPGLGYLPINAFVLTGAEPMLIDTGLVNDRPDFLEAVASIVPLADLRWVCLTHDDADHTGSIAQIMERAPKARLLTHGVGALRMSTWWPVPLRRVHALTVGARVSIGDRMMRAVRPPLYDNPMSTGLFDELTGTLFSVDSFGAILPAPAQDAAEVPQDALMAGMTAWATFDSPWVHLVDHGKFAVALREVEALQPSRVLSSHLPAASGSVDRFLAALAKVPDAEPAAAPDPEIFDLIIAGLEAQEGRPAAAEAAVDAPAVVEPAATS